MTCRHIEGRLAEGEPLTPELELHVLQCEGCRALLEAFPPDALSLPEAAFDRERVRRTMGTLLPQLTAVRPLPSDPALILLSLATFVAFALLVAATVGFQGYRALTATQRTLYFASLLLIGLLFSIHTVASAIPGAKARLRGSRIVFGCVLVLAGLVSALFGNFSLAHFASQGIPCLRFGCLCAALFGILAAVFLRRGLLTNTIPTTTFIGCFAGFSGVAALSLHCPLPNAAHIIVWHLGAVAAGALGGLLTGYVLQRTG